MRKSGQHEIHGGVRVADYHKSDDGGDDGDPGDGSIIINKSEEMKRIFLRMSKNLGNWSGIFLSPSLMDRRSKTVPVLIILCLLPPLDAAPLHAMRTHNVDSQKLPTLPHVVPWWWWWWWW